MPFGGLKVCGDVMWMVVSHVEGEGELVSRFTLTVRREDVFLNVGASCERGYPVVKGNCSISEHDDRPLLIASFRTAWILSVLTQSVPVKSGHRHGNHQCSTQFRTNWFRINPP